MSPAIAAHCIVQAYCGGPEGDSGFLPALAAFLPQYRKAAILDGGANIGTATMLFAQLSGGSGEIIAVEASPENSAMLERNTAALRKHGAIRTVQAAITSHPLARSGANMTLSGTAGQHWGFRLVRNSTHYEQADTGRLEDALAAMAPSSVQGAGLEPVKYQVPTTSLPLLEVRIASGAVCRAPGIVRMRGSDRVDLLASKGAVACCWPFAG